MNIPMSLRTFLIHLRHRWYGLPALSGVLLTLTFYPLDLWPLGFVALAPLYYSIVSASGGAARPFAKGFVTGAVFAAFLSLVSVVQFHWLPPAPLFPRVVHITD